jgi:hypothetical protein
VISLLIKCLVCKIQTTQETLSQKIKSKFYVAVQLLRRNTESF